MYLRRTFSAECSRDEILIYQGCIKKENIEQQSGTRCFPEGRKNLFITSFIIGNDIIAL